MSNNLLNIGVSGLNAAQFGLSVTGNNIANAATPGYNRQTAVFSQMSSQPTAQGALGRGVDVDAIQRVYDQFLTAQVNQAQTSYSQFNTYYQQVSQINDMLSDGTSGLSPALQTFFQGVQTAAGNASDASARQTLIANAQGLASVFQSLGGTLDTLRQGVNDQIGSVISSINSDAQQLAQLNQQIAASASANGGQPPNDLLDKRDQVVADLNQWVRTTVVKSDDGSYNVFVGNGQSLVAGQQSFALKAIASASDPSRMTVGYSGPGGAVVTLPENSIDGGALGGLLQFRSQTLDPAQNALGRIAVVLADSFNQQHALGIDQNGAPGGAFFTTPVPSVIGATGNSANAQVNASITDASQLTTSDYQLSFDGTQYTLKRLSDGTSTTYATGALPITRDGVTFDVPAGHALQAGDSFLIEPTRNGASHFDVAISDPSKVALAAPILAQASTGNTGSGKIDNGAVDASYLADPLTGPVNIAYQGGQLTLPASAFPLTVTVGGVTTTYDTATPVPYDPAKGTATLSFGGVTVNLSGQPADGDTFTVGPNTGAMTDNRNGLLLAGLQNQNTVAGGTTTYAGAFGQLTAQIGASTTQSKSSAAAQNSLLTQAQKDQQSVSGVNLDEEATNLIRYQQMYQANSKVIQTAAQLFDAILNINN